MDKPPVVTYDFVMGQLKILAATAIAYAVGKGWLTPTDAGLLTTFLTSFGVIVIPFVWSGITNAGTKKVPANSVAIMPQASEDAGMVARGAAQVGDNIAGRVVGGLLIAFLLNTVIMGTHAYAGDVRTARAQLLNFPKLPASSATIASGRFLDVIKNWASQDIDGAIELSTSIPELQDVTGATCWKAFKGIGDVIAKHPLPVTLKLATDVQSARLVSMALKKICVEPACAQVWMDMQNQIAALAPLGVPFTLASVCSKVI